LSRSSRRPPALLAAPWRVPLWILLAEALVGAGGALLISMALVGLAAAPDLQARLVGSATFAVSGRMDSGALESSDAAAARTREILAAQAGVTAVRILDPSPRDPLLARLIGAPRVSPDAGPPRLLEASLRRESPDAVSRLNAALAAEGVLSAADDHGLFTGPCERMAVGLCVSILAGLVALASLCAGLAGVAARARAEGAWDRLDLLARLGAEPSGLNAAVAVPAAALSLCALGLGGAATMAGLLLMPGAVGLPGLDLAGRPSPLAGAVVAAWTIAAGVAAARSARRSATRRLGALFS
jgi:hypothetical protein